MRMNSFEGKSLLAFVREGDFAHPGEAEAIELAFSSIDRGGNLDILDAGCGLGGTAAYVAKRWGKVTGIDIDNVGIAYARETYPEVTFASMDLLDAGEACPVRFDVAYTMTVLYAVGNKAAAVKSLVKTLKAGGKLILLEYDLKRPKEWTDGDLLSARPPSGEELISCLGRLGLRCEREDVSTQFAVWYARLVDRLQDSRVTSRYPRSETAAVLAKYQGILASIERGELGGVLVTATKRA